MLAEVINWVCLLVFLGTLAAYMEALDGALGAFLIAINVTCFAMIVTLIYKDINREKAAIKFAMQQARAQMKRLKSTPGGFPGNTTVADEKPAKDDGDDADDAETALATVADDVTAVDTI